MPRVTFVQPGLRPRRALPPCGPIPSLVRPVALAPRHGGELVFQSRWSRRPSTAPLRGDLRDDPHWRARDSARRLFEKQSRATDPELRKRPTRQVERRLLNEEAHDLVTLSWQRIIPRPSKVGGRQITPSPALDNQLDTEWLAE